MSTAATRLFDEPIVFLGEIDSTMDELARRLAAGERPRAVVADAQRAGRGRRGRRWRSLDGDGRYISLPVSLHGLAPESWSSLSLVAGLALVRMLRHQCADDLPLGLKWPNDLVTQDGAAKLGGILLEVVENGSGPIALVGVGVNLRAKNAIQDRAALEAEAPAYEGLERWGCRLEEAGWAAALADTLSDLVKAWREEGFGPLRSAYAELDVLRGRTLFWREGAEKSLAKGVGRGVDAAGALCVEVEGTQKVLNAGEVFLVRPEE